MQELEVMKQTTNKSGQTRKEGEDYEGIKREGDREQQVDCGGKGHRER